MRGRSAERRKPLLLDGARHLHIQHALRLAGAAAQHRVRTQPHLPEDLMRSDRAQSLIEFALAVPVLLLVVLGSFDAARAAWQLNSIGYAAREGARYAIAHCAVSDAVGQAVVLFAALALGLISMIGLAIDAGLLYSARRAAQDAADAAAIAGAIVMRQEGDPEDIVAAARDDAARNGYSGSDVTIEYPPLTGAHAGNILYIRVTLAT